MPCYLQNYLVLLPSDAAPGHLPALDEAREQLHQHWGPCAFAGGSPERAELMLKESLLLVHSAFQWHSE